MQRKDYSIPLWEKYALTIDEASEYYNIGDKKLRSLAEHYRDSGFVICSGVKVLFNRKSLKIF